MAATTHLYEIFIRAPRERVWEALVSEDDTVRYFHGTRFESRFEPGAPYVNRIVAADRPAVDGIIEEYDPPNRLVLTWHVLYDDEMAAEPPGRVEWILTDANSEGTVTRVSLRHGDLAQSPVTWRHVKLGWVAILDSLKSLLETGEPLGDVDDAVADIADVEGTWHRSQAIAAHNSIWDLLDGRSHSPDEADDLLSRSYAAAFHWRRAADRRPINAARASYMIAKAHTVLGQSEIALASIERYAALLDEAGDDAADFDRAYLHEGRARALACAGRYDDAEQELALALATPIADDEDRRIVEGDLAAGPWFGLPQSTPA